MPRFEPDEGCAGLVILACKHNARCHWSGVELGWSDEGSTADSRAPSA